ncbi:MAG: GtrA family protein [Actinomycetota bacterium]
MTTSLNHLDTSGPATAGPLTIDLPVADSIGGHGPSNRTKLIRYAVVTLIASPGNLALYGLLLALTTWPAIAANLAAAVTIAVPTFILNRRWVWSRRDASAFRSEILPYWAATVLNVALSSAAAARLDAAGAGDGTLVAATFAVYAVLWLVRFAFLDVLFSRRRS